MVAFTGSAAFNYTSGYALERCPYFGRDFNMASTYRSLPSRMNHTGILSPIFFIRMIRTTSF